MLEKWERGALGILDRQHHSLRYFFDFIEKEKFKKTIEFGTFKGSSLLATALLKEEEEMGSQCLTLGVDSFNGFPSYAAQDAIENFSFLLDNNQISQAHYDRVMRSLEIAKLRVEDPSASNISSSGNFSATSPNFLKKKISFLKFSHHVDFIQADFSDFDTFLETLTGTNLPIFDSMLIDCDLYYGYKTALQFALTYVRTGGVIFLDEYYSLKFPGGRIAVDEFLSNYPNIFLLERCDYESDDFERWFLRRVG